MRYVVRLVVVSTLVALAMYGLDYLFPAADRFPSGLSIFAVSFLLAAIPTPNDLRDAPPAIMTRLVAPAMGIALALWITVGISDLQGHDHSDSVLVIGGVCLLVAVFDRIKRWRRQQRAARAAESGRGASHDDSGQTP